MKIVITGVPAIGKTTLIDILKREFDGSLVLCQDALEIFRAGHFPSPQSVEGRKARQRALYHVQKELEQIAVLRAREKMIICDHGTLDGLVDWPTSTNEFFENVDSSLEAELGRYDRVISIGNESLPELSTVLWQKHPRFLPLPLSDRFSTCYTKVCEIIKSLLERQEAEGLTSPPASYRP